MCPRGGAIAGQPLSSGRAARTGELKDRLQDSIQPLSDRVSTTQQPQFKAVIYATGPDATGVSVLVPARRRALLRYITVHEQ